MSSFLIKLVFMPAFHYRSKTNDYNKKYLYYKELYNIVIKYNSIN